jgi:hypothetical protein
MAVDQATRGAALKALDTIKQYSREGFTYGADRIHLYYYDVEGDWLNEFECPVNGEHRLPEEADILHPVHAIATGTEPAQRTAQVPVGQLELA